MTLQWMFGARRTRAALVAVTAMSLWMAGCAGSEGTSYTVPSRPDANNGTPQPGNNGGGWTPGNNTNPNNPTTGNNPNPNAPDAGPVEPENPGADDAPTPLADIARTGSGAVLLRGVVLAPDRILDPGEVLVVGDRIACVDTSCAQAPEAQQATIVETRGVISPGLIDAHNHLPYNFLPQWVPTPMRLYSNRYQWADEAAYEEHVKPYAKNRSKGSHYCPAAKWGELRSLIHATTTVQGQSFNQSCVNWGVRNADHHHNLQHNHMRTYIGSPRDLTDADAQKYVDAFNDPLQPATRLVVHMTEGIEGNNVLEEFDSFAGRDSRTNRHRGVSLLQYGTAVLIHSMALTEEQLQEVRHTRSMVVWSPSSNVVLYGVTAPIKRMLELEIPVGLGPDWTVSGEEHMLAEMRFAREYARSENIGLLDSRKLWQMATAQGAHVVGLDQHIGRLAPGMRADIAVFGRRGPDPYESVINSRAEDVRLVMVDGKVLYGDANLRPVAANPHCETFAACASQKFLCVQDAPDAANRRNETLNDVRTQLFNILEGTGYPADEQYGRGNQLLDLVDCRN